MTSCNDECPVCMETCAELSVTCCNGHKVCEKHFLQRAKAVYEEDRMAFGGDSCVQRCFVCRTDLGNDRFSDNYHKLINWVIIYGVMPLMREHTLGSGMTRNELARKSMEHLNEHFAKLDPRFV